MDEFYNDMNEAADEGWKQMKVLLEEHGLAGNIVSKKRKTFFVVWWRSVTILLLIAICCLPFFLQNPGLVTPRPLQKDADKINIVAKNNASRQKQIIKASSRNNQPQPITDIASDNINVKAGDKFFPENENSLKNETGYNDFAIINNDEENFAYVKQQTGPIISHSLPGKGILETINDEQELHKDSSIYKKIGPIKKDFSKKIGVYAGAGVNVPSLNHQFSFDLKHTNVHPSVQILFPLSKKYTLHASIDAISILHGKEVVKQEKEDVNSIDANVSYKLNTTSIIKASYIDITTSLNYQFNEHWSVGAGFQLSKFYKLKVEKQKETYNFSNALVASDVNVYTISRSEATAVVEEKVNIKSFDTRALMETNFKTGRWLFSAGYIYGLGKTVNFQTQYGNFQHYRNQYLRLGVQYRLTKK